MSSVLAYNAFKSRLVDQLGSTYPIRDWEEIEVSLGQGTTPWIALDDSPSEGTNTSVGAPTQNWVEYVGLLDFHVFVPSNGSLSVARDIGDQIVTVLQFHYFTGLPAGHQLRTYAAGTAGPGIIHDGLWHSTIQSVSYRHRYAVATAAE